MVKKIETNAAKAGKTPQAFVDEIVEGSMIYGKHLIFLMINLLEQLMKNIWKQFKPYFHVFSTQGDIYLGNYEGWYCTHEETFWTDTQVGP